MASLDEVPRPEGRVIIEGPRDFVAVSRRLSDVRLRLDEVVPHPDAAAAAVAQLFRWIGREHGDQVQLLLVDQVSQDAKRTIDHFVQVCPGKSGNGSRLVSLAPKTTKLEVRAT